MAEPRENTDYAAFTRRTIRGLGRRVAAGDVDALPLLVELQADLDAAIAEAIVGLRSEPNLYSAAQIADRLGVTRQAVMQRWPIEDRTRIRQAGGQPIGVR